MEATVNFHRRQLFKFMAASPMVRPPFAISQANIQKTTCYSDDWQRTKPDSVVYLPPEPPFNYEAFDHVLVTVTPSEDLLAVWTAAVKPDYSDYSVVHARSTDGGLTWSPPRPIAPPAGMGTYACFGWPVISKTGRIYVFYNFAPGVGDDSVNAVMRCKYSDDDGRTWRDDGAQLPYRRTRYDHPDPKVFPKCIVWQKPVRDNKGRPVVPLTRWTANYVKRQSRSKHITDCHCEFIRYENIDEGPLPKDVKLTFLPTDDHLVSVPVNFEPERSEGYSFCQEPGLVPLPDGRLFAPMRTANGQVWYTVSDPSGETWRPAEVLRYRDDGDLVLNPVAPTPMYRLADGRYLLFICNHDGYGYGAQGPLDNHFSRRPQFIAVGEFRPHAQQPIWFSRPKLLFDTENVGVYPFYYPWLSMYASLTEHRGKRTLWYADRKMFVLGRHIPDSMLADMIPPT